MPALLIAVFEKELRRNVLDVAVPSSLEHMPLTHSCLDVFRTQLHVWNVYAGSGGARMEGTAVCMHAVHSCVYACRTQLCVCMPYTAVSTNAYTTCVIACTQELRIYAGYMQPGV
jgi:hypothetical protein